MPRDDAIIFRDLVGKLDVLNIPKATNSVVRRVHHRSIQNRSSDAHSCRRRAS